MSIRSWKDKYYPVPADQVPKEQAVAHSLRKWEGLREGNLDEHDLCAPLGSFSLSGCGPDPFYVDGGTCALCEWYAYRDDEGCAACPIFKHQGYDCNAPNSQWDQWKRYRDPEPMIELLTILAEKEKQRC